MEENFDVSKMSKEELLKFRGFLLNNKHLEDLQISKLKSVEDKLLSEGIDLSKLVIPDLDEKETGKKTR